MKTSFVLHPVRLVRISSKPTCCNTVNMPDLLERWLSSLLPSALGRGSKAFRHTELTYQVLLETRKRIGLQKDGLCSERQNMMSPCLAQQAKDLLWSCATKIPFRAFSKLAHYMLINFECQRCWLQSLATGSVRIQNQVDVHCTLRHQNTGTHLPSPSWKHQSVQRQFLHSVNHAGSHSYLGTEETSDQSSYLSYNKNQNGKRQDKYKWRSLEQEKTFPLKWKFMSLHRTSPLHRREGNRILHGREMGTSEDGEPRIPNYSYIYIFTVPPSVRSRMRPVIKRSRWKFWSLVSTSMQRVQSREKCSYPIVLVRKNEFQLTITKQCLKFLVLLCLRDG